MAEYLHWPKLPVQARMPILPTSLKWIILHCSVVFLSDCGADGGCWKVEPSVCELHQEAFADQLHVE